jgi:predicted DNA-binding transcriptional regulator YafY
MFTADELTLVERLAAETRAEGREDMAGALDALAAKLRALEAGRASAGGRLTLFEEVLPLPSAAAAPETVLQVRRALEREEPIRIRYRGNRSGEVTLRRIRPFNIHFYNGQEYVEAFCELRGADRIFALANIEEILEPEAAAETDPFPEDDGVA